MFYLLIGVIGALAGWVTGQTLKGSDQAVGVDITAGALGAWVAVVLSRAVGPAAASGALTSIIVAVIGATLTLYAMRRFMKTKVVPVARPRRRL